MDISQKSQDEIEILRKVITKGDLSDLSPEEQLRYYLKMCERHDLDPFSKPFDFLEIIDKKSGQRKVLLYGNKECAAQLRTNAEVSIYKIEKEKDDNVFTVTTYAKTADGREDIDIGVTPIRGLMGESYANALKRAITQSKRRVTLSICGLGYLDESEIDSIPGAKPVGQIDQQPEPELIVEANHNASGLDQWACGRGLAMKIIGLSSELKTRGITDDVIKSWLPKKANITSRKDLDENQALKFIENLSLRIKLIELCSELAHRGVDNETMKKRLPGGLSSLKDLNLEQVHEAIKIFTHWLKSWNEMKEEAA